jgi:mycothiol synthase
MNNNLSNGYIIRRLELSDAEAVAEMINARMLETIGVANSNAEENIVFWELPGFDITRDAVLVVDADGKPAAYADVSDANDPHVHIYSFGCVHPQHSGRGLGGYLADWLVERGCSGLGRAPEGARVVLVQFVPVQEKAGARVLESRGFEHVRGSYLMRIEMDAEPAAPEIPAGITIRPIHMDTEFEAAVRTIRTAFLDHYGFVEEPFEQSMKRWRHIAATDSHFDPSVWFMAMDGNEVAGVCYCTPFTQEDPEMAWVNTLGVRREWRGRGIGHALLRISFAEFYRRGFRKVGLGVDSQSLTGATRLYEKAGMNVFREYLAYEKEIRPGVELATQSLD